MKNDVRSSIRSRLDALADDLEKIVRDAALQLVSESLASFRVGSGAPSRGRGSASRLAPASRKRGRRAPTDTAAAADKILSYVKSNPGVRAEVARAAVGVDKALWIRAASKLIAEKKLTKRGEKRATVYTAK